MKKMVSWSLAVSLLGASSPAFADLFDGLVSDTELLQEDISTNEKAMDRQQEDYETLSNSDLFPQQEEEEQQGSSSSSSKQGNFVTVMVNDQEVTLRDVPLSAWFALFVRDLAGKSIISGYTDAQGRPLGLFGPADKVTVEQLAKMALGAAGVDPVSCGKKATINKSAKSRWSEQYIVCAEVKGFAVFSDGSIDVTKPATRAQVVVTVLQAFGVELDPKKGNVFTDVDNSTEFAAAIETAAADFIVAGYTDASGKPLGLFKPANPVNRAEIAKIISLAMQVYK